jgi:acyl-CoA thioester hydrolase
MTHTRVRFADTDAAGIVHYAQYLAYLEVGRAEALRSAGLTSEIIATCTLNARLVEAAIKYRAPARFDDLLDVQTWIAEISNPEFRFGYEINRPADHVVVATAESLHTWAVPSPAMSAQLPEWLLSALDQLRA